MKKTSIILSFLLVGIVQGLMAQNKPAPEYLTKQSFPDSVLQMQFATLDGKSVSLQQILADKKGKKVFVDIWASWCKDCIVGLPDLAKLQSSSKDVAYVFLSVDRGEDKWKKAVDKYGIKGEHYYITTGWNSALTDYIGLDWIPRYFVLDEKGDIILSKSVKADDKKLKEVLLP